MQFHSLVSVELKDLVATFNNAFAEYYVPVQVTPETLAIKLQSEGTDLRVSVGAFSNGQLVGFILHGIDDLNGRRTAYNGGTGVLPAFRGQALTQRMYAAILPHLRTAGIAYTQLEVMVQNAAARRCYAAVGFTHLRGLKFYQQTETLVWHTPPFEISNLSNLTDWPIAAWHDWQPTWQHSIATVQRANHHVMRIGCRVAGQMAAYAVFNPRTGRILQLAVAPPFRRQKLGTALLHHIGQTCSKPLSVLNVEDSAAATCAFLEQTGFVSTMGQVELGMLL